MVGFTFILDLIKFKSKFLSGWATLGAQIDPTCLFNISKLDKCLLILSSLKITKL